MGLRGHFACSNGMRPTEATMWMGKMDRIHEMLLQQNLGCEKGFS